MNILNFIYRMFLWVAVFSGIALFVTCVYMKNFSDQARYNQIYDIYKQLIAQTGQVQDALPLYIIDEDVENAYNDGEKIVIYTGLIKNANSIDEIALVLGHEIAHGTLRHLDELGTDDPNKIQPLEANADKMGAVYMMKAGYDVCKGRMIFKRWYEESGNALQRAHPDLSYRFEELNINCE